MGGTAVIIAFAVVASWFWVWLILKEKRAKSCTEIDLLNHVRKIVMNQFLRYLDEAVDGILEAKKCLKAASADAPKLDQKTRDYMEQIKERARGLVVQVEGME